MYMDSGSCGALDSRNRSCAVMSDAVPSSMGPLTQMMRSRSSRLKMSNTRSPRLHAGKQLQRGRDAAQRLLHALSAQL
jgi:hypothetical protein